MHILLCTVYPLADRIAFADLSDQVQHAVVAGINTKELVCVLWFGTHAFLPSQAKDEES